MSVVEAAPPADGVIDALQECLAGEHAAVYGYGVLGGVLSVVGPSSAEHSRARTSYAAHLQRRDDLSEIVAGLDATPVAADPAYTTPFKIRGMRDCRRLARLLEHRLAAVYATAVSQTAGDLRSMALASLTACALRELAWGGAPEAFPGVAEL